MINESKQKEEAEIVDGGYVFEDIYSKPFVKMEILDLIKKADILILPYEKNFRAGEGYLFPENTSQFYYYLIEKLKEQEIKVEICSTDEEYKEIQLHEDVINIPEMILNSAFFQIVISLIASYLYDTFNCFNKKNIDVDINLIVEKNGNSKKIHYKGSIENFAEAMKSVRKYSVK